MQRQPGPELNIRHSSSVDTTALRALLSVGGEFGVVLLQAHCSFSISPTQDKHWGGLCSWGAAPGGTGLVLSTATSVSPAVGQGHLDASHVFQVLW